MDAVLGRGLQASQKHFLKTTIHVTTCSHTFFKKEILYNNVLCHFGRLQKESIRINKIFIEQASRAQKEDRRIPETTRELKYQGKQPPAEGSLQTALAPTPLGEMPWAPGAPAPAPPVRKRQPRALWQHNSPSHTRQEQVSLEGLGNAQLSLPGSWHFVLHKDRGAPSAPSRLPLASPAPDNLLPKPQLPRPWL